MLSRSHVSENFRIYTPPVGEKNQNYLRKLAVKLRQLLLEPGHMLYMRLVCTIMLSDILQAAVCFGGGDALVISNRERKSPDRTLIRVIPIIRMDS